MPTSGTHITIVQRLASEPKYKPLLGDPDPMLPETDPEALKMRFACLGAVGPDIFYALADYGGDLQDLESTLVKIAGTFNCLSKLSEGLNRWVKQTANAPTQGVLDSLMAQSALISGVINESILSLFTAGVNLWPVFEPARQKDVPREGWFWADYLHYVRSGKFVGTLLKLSQNNPFLHAYSLGYLTHYVTDTVGHPYVNQVVGAPWRLAWQRHHLMENFQDAYVWDRWHVPSPSPPPPSAAEQPLDVVVSAANTMGMGAPMTYARLHDWINIGSPGVDPVDTIVEAVCMQIQQGLFDIGILEDIDPMPPVGAEFERWTNFMATAFKQAYKGTIVPMNLTMNVVPGNPLAPRTSPLPTAADVAAAYGVFRLVMKIGTEEQIKDPMPPNLTADISAAVNSMMAAIAADLAGIPAPPSVPMGGTFSPAALLTALMNAATWAAAVVDAVIAAGNDLLQGLANIGTAVAADTIKYVLWLVNKALYGLYRALRDTLVMRAYSIPYTDEITGMIGPLDVQTLWRSLGNAAPVIIYPHEEMLSMRTKVGSNYNPAFASATPPERPPLTMAAPYTATPDGAGGLIPTLPDDFIEAPLGPTDMFSTKNGNGPETPTVVAKIQTFTETPGRNFGGALANCRKGIDLAAAGKLTSKQLPDYNLDGDRSYAWPCWDVTPRTAPKTTVADPLAPDSAPINTSAGGVATVHAVPVPPP